MKLILLILMLVTMSFGSNNYNKEIMQMSKSQLDVLRKSYHTGKKDDLGYILAAIAWQESNCGEYLINIGDGKSAGSYGPFHISLNSAAKRNNANTKWKKSRVAEQLVKDFNFSAKEAIAELKYWRKVHAKKPIGYVIASYNAGSVGIKSKDGSKYSNDILQRVNALKNSKILYM